MTESITTVQFSTITHRCAHRNPNLAQVPSDQDLENYSSQVLEWLCAVLICLGLSFGCLAHYLCPMVGLLPTILLHGDIHQVNADKIGITRKQVKTVTYAFLYGAGDEKIGLSYDKLLSSKQSEEARKEIRACIC